MPRRTAICRRCQSVAVPIAIVGCIVVAAGAWAVQTPDLPLHLPGPPSAPAPNALLRSLLAHARRTNFGLNWRKVGDEAARQRCYALAADAYSREAAIYRRNGDPNAAIVELAKASRYRPTATAYTRDTATSSDRNRLATGARSEPPLGCYLGAYIDRDDTLPGGYLDENAQLHKDSSLFEQATGRQHATHFMYMAYGRRFPWAWANELKRRGQIPHIAWEPRSLDEMTVDQALLDFAEACRRYDYPIFLRLAAEMNGDWAPYHGDPAAYRAAFRGIASVIHHTAPKAIMLWCPDAQPLEPIAAYYPGDDAVDWVGVNFYSVVFYDNNPSRPANDDPTDLLRPVYDRYAGRKPIAIGEYAATHMQQADGVPRPGFACEKLARLYAALPRLFPRVKMVNWYDANNLLHAQPGRQLNNYQLTDYPEITQAYHDATADPWYMGRAFGETQVVYHTLRNGAALSGTVPLSAWTRAPQGNARVYWSIDAVVRFATARPGAASWEWNTRGETNGKHRVSLLVYDARGRFVAGRGYTVIVRN